MSTCSALRVLSTLFSFGIPALFFLGLQLRYYRRHGFLLKARNPTHQLSQVSEVKRSYDRQTGNFRRFSVLYGAWLSCVVFYIVDPSGVCSFYNLRWALTIHEIMLLLQVYLCAHFTLVLAGASQPLLKTSIKGGFWERTCRICMLVPKVAAVYIALTTTCRLCVLWLSASSSSDMPNNVTRAVHGYWTSVDGLICSVVLFMAWYHFRSVLDAEITRASGRARDGVLGYLRHLRTFKSRGQNNRQQTESHNSNLEVESVDESHDDSAVTENSVADAHRLEKEVRDFARRRSIWHKASLYLTTSIMRKRTSVVTPVTPSRKLSIRSTPERRDDRKIGTETLESNAMLSQRIRTLHSMNSAKKSLNLLTGVSVAMFLAIASVHITLLVQSAKSQRTSGYGWFSLVYAAIVSHAAVCLGWDRNRRHETYSSASHRNSRSRLEVSGRRRCASVFAPTRQNNTSIRIDITRPKERMNALNQKVNADSSKPHVATDEESSGRPVDSILNNLRQQIVLSLVLKEVNCEPSQGSANARLSAHSQKSRTTASSRSSNSARGSTDERSDSNDIGSLENHEMWRSSDASQLVDSTVLSLPSTECNSESVE